MKGRAGSGIRLPQRRPDQAPKGFAEDFAIYELREANAAATPARPKRSCRRWEAVYAALRDGPLVAAETKLDLFLAKYPADSVARYHRSIYDDAAAMSRSSGQKSKPALLGGERG